MIAMNPVGKLVRRALRTPEILALTPYWLIPLGLLVGYFVQLPDAVAAGITPLEFSSVFLTRVSIWLAPVTVPVFGSLMIYLYLHNVCIPIAGSATGGKAGARRAFLSIASLLLDASLSIVTWWRGLDTRWKLPTRSPTTSPLLLPPQRGLPSHLSIGWSPGVNPQVVYG